MAIVLTKDQKVVNGQFIKVQNDKIKSSSESKEYYALWTIDEASNDETCLLFTAGEINKAKLLFTAGEINKAKLLGGTLGNNLKYGKLYTYGKILTYPKYIVRVTWTNGKDAVLQFSQSVIELARKRAENNIEDIPKKNWFYDKIVEEIEERFF